MSGYLRRLVQRTLQSTPEIRSTARLPFAPLSARDTRESILEDISEEPFAPRETMREAQPNPVFGSNNVDALPGAPDKLISEPDRLLSISHSKSIKDQQSRPAVKPVSEQEGAEHHPQERAQSSNSQFETINQLSNKNYVPKKTNEPPENSLLNQFTNFKLRIAGAQPTSKQPNASDSPTLTRGVRTVDNDFEPLVNIAAQIDVDVERQPVSWAADRKAPEYVSSTEPPRKPSARLRNQPMENREPKTIENNEVHVTIGRIEITAVHTPQPTKPAPSSAKKPMSLDDYLAKRNGTPL